MEEKMIEIQRPKDITELNRLIGKLVVLKIGLGVRKLKTFSGVVKGIYKCQNREYYEFLNQVIEREDNSINIRGRDEIFGERISRESFDSLSRFDGDSAVYVNSENHLVGDLDVIQMRIYYKNPPAIYLRAYGADNEKKLYDEKRALLVNNNSWIEPLGRYVEPNGLQLKVAFNLV